MIICYNGRGAWRHKCTRCSHNTSYLGKRASGAHTDVLSLVKGILTPSEYHNIQKQFTSLLSMKNASEYQPDLMDKQDAENAVKWADRIIFRVKDKLMA